MKAAEFLKNLIKPKPNTIWDYVVPLSLVGLAFFVHDYAFWNTFDLASVLFTQTPERLATKANLYELIIIELIVTSILVVATIFLTRVQRVIAFILLPVISIIVLSAFDKVLKIFGIQLLTGIGAILLFYFTFLTAGFFFGNISLLIRYGNNFTKKISTFKTSPLRSGIAWSIYGFYLDRLDIYSGFHGPNAVSFFIFENLYRTLGIPPLTPLFTILFAILGYSIEKFKQRGGA